MGDNAEYFRCLAKGVPTPGDKSGLYGELIVATSREGAREIYEGRLRKLGVDPNGVKLDILPTHIAADSSKIGTFYTVGRRKIDAE